MIFDFNTSLGNKSFLLKHGIVGFEEKTFTLNPTNINDYFMDFFIPEYWYNNVDFYTFCNENYDYDSEKYFGEIYLNFNNDYFFNGCKFEDFNEVLFNDGIEGCYYNVCCDYSSRLIFTGNISIVIGANEFFTISDSYYKFRWRCDTVVSQYASDCNCYEYVDDFGNTINGCDDYECYCGYREPHDLSYDFDSVFNFWRNFVIGFYNHDLNYCSFSGICYKDDCNFSVSSEFSDRFVDKDFFVVLNIFDFVSYYDVYRCGYGVDNWYDVCKTYCYNNSYGRFFFKERYVIGAFKFYNGAYYCVRQNHFYDDNWLDFAVRLDDDNGDFVSGSFDFVRFYNPSAPGELNLFGKSFNIEIVEASMACSDECLLDLISAINNLGQTIGGNLVSFNKSFSEAFNKVPISDQYSFGSGSVFKSNDLDNHDYYFLIDNKGKTCLSPIFIDKCDSDDLGSSAQKPLYISNTDTKGSSCNNPLYLNLCEMPAIKINDLFNRISVGGIDINSLPLDYTSLISTLLGSIITSLGNLLKPSDTLTIALPNIQISNVPSIDINSMPNINISNSSSSPVNIALSNGSSCNEPLHIDLCPFAFSEIPVRINSIPPLDVDIDTMPINRTVTHLNNAVDISCICDELDDIDKGLVAEFASLGVSLASVKSAIDNVASKFVTSCDTSIGEAFSEAFNLTNCLGSVFKVNDNNWSGEDTISGIWYKILDFDFVNTNSIYSPFYSSYPAGSRIKHWNLPDLFVNSLFRTGSLGQNLNSLHSVFNVSGQNTASFSDVLNRSLFSDSSNNSLPTKGYSVFTFGYGSDGNKILNHRCDVNPNSIKFCDNSLPVDIINPSNNPVKVEMEPTSSTINVNVESSPADGDSIFINADGKTLLNTSNFK